MAGEFIDISAVLSDGMVVWPGDPPTRITRFMDVDRSDSCTLSHLEMCAHSGTHIDAPFHYFPDGARLEQMPLQATVGPCRVVEIADCAQVTSAELQKLSPRAGERLLLKTRNSRRRWEVAPFDEQFVSLSAEGASFLVRSGIQTLGVDYLSVGAVGGEGESTHRTLLRAGIWIIEGLNLMGVPPGQYELLCLALRGLGGDGAPARAVLKSL